MNEIKTIGIVSPSFFVEKEEEFARGIQYFEELGIRIKKGNCVGKRCYNTTGTAEERAEEINEMFEDSEVDMIIASDGGCRAIEILRYLNMEMIRKNPKPIGGFSDITHILLAIYAKTGNACIHGMDIINGFGQEESDIKKKNCENFFDTCYNGTFDMRLEEGVTLRAGNGEGIVIGGWLNAIQHLAGTEYFPKDEKIILLWEAIDEEPNRINMMLHSLRATGLFDRVKGMVVGQLTDCEEKEYFDCIPEIEDIILGACEGYDFPIIINAPFGHGLRKNSFRYGAKTKICARTGYGK